MKVAQITVARSLYVLFATSLTLGSAPALALSAAEQRRVMESILDTHQLIARDLKRNVERLESLCKSPSSRRDTKAEGAIPKARLEVLERRMSSQVQSNAAISALTESMRSRLQREVALTCSNVTQDSERGLCEASKRGLSRANEIHQWGTRWQALQIERLRLVDDVAKLEMRGCTRKGFYDRLLAADSELVASGPDGGLSLFEELTGSRATRAQAPQQPTPARGRLQELFDRLFPGAGSESTGASQRR